MSKVKVFISQPMKGLTTEQIKANRLKLEAVCQLLLSVQGVAFIDSFIKETPPETCKTPSSKSLWYLGQSISKLAEADVLVMPKGADETNNGCRVEHLAAELYGMDILDIGV